MQTKHYETVIHALPDEWENNETRKTTVEYMQRAQAW
jgi:hypothetical protein